MPAYGLPGASTSPRTARTTGIIAVGMILIGLVGWIARPDGTDPDAMDITLVTETVGEGIASGTDVRRHGVTVGTVISIERAAAGQYVRLGLDSSAVAGLTTALSIDYSPSNLFGITQITLLEQSGGSPLQNGDELDLTGPNSDRVHDATTSAFLNALGGLTNEVLTPELAELASTLARETRAFTPLLEAIIATAESIEKTQVMPYSGIIQGLGDTFLGLPSTLHGGLVLLDSVYDEPYLAVPENREKFDKTVSVLGQQLIPSIAHLLTTLQPDYQGLAALPVPLLDAVTASGATATPGDLGQLVDRLDAAFADSPAGPVLRLALGISGGDR